MEHDLFSDYRSLLSEGEIRQLDSAGMGSRGGFGDRPALLIVDAQKFEVGATEAGDNLYYPSACATAHDALPVIRKLAEAFRAAKRPIYYSQLEYKRDGSDYAGRHFKRPFRELEGWCIEGTKGVEIFEAVKPQAGDHVIKKTRPSFFHGTPLLAQLIQQRIDTLIVSGGTTSNCIRATVIDAASYNFRTSVVRDAVFDRVRISHEVSLMDMSRTLADIVALEEVLSYLREIGEA